MKKNHKSSLKVLIPAILIELYFFYRRSFVMSEMFFLVWFLIFGTLFAFRWVDGSSSTMGIGGGARFLAAKYSESMFPDKNAGKFKKSDFILDLMFMFLAIANLALSLVSYYIG